jgi:hypothetical protein
MSPPKPHRFLLARVSGAADEANAFLKRRRISRKPFARVHAPGGRSIGLGAESEQGRALFSAAAKLIDAAREPVRD